MGVDVYMDVSSIYRHLSKPTLSWPVRERLFGYLAFRQCTRAVLKREYSVSVCVYSFVCFRVWAIFICILLLILFLLIAGAVLHTQSILQK